MSATEIIEELQKLPVSEQERVLAYLAKSRSGRRAGEREVRYATDAEFDKVADSVLREHLDLFRRLAK